jgi:hypothetical protein
MIGGPHGLRIRQIHRRRRGAFPPTLTLALD